MQLTEQELKQIKSKQHTIQTQKGVLTFIGKGGQGIVYKISDKECIKIYYDIAEYIKEKLYFQMTRIYVLSYVTPNLMESKNDFEIFNSGIVEMDLMDGTLEDWMKNKHKENDWQSALFQIVYGMIVLNKRMHIHHNDMKPKNILYKTKSEVYCYEVKNNVYFVPIKSLFKISDFSKSSLDTKTSSKDYMFLNSLHNRLKVDKLQKNIEPTKAYNLAITNTKFLQFYNSENSKLKNLDHMTKKKLLHRATIYFLIENNMVNTQIFRSKKIESMFELLGRLRYENMFDILDDLGSKYKEKKPFSKKFSYNNTLIENL